MIIILAEHPSCQALKLVKRKTHLVRQSNQENQNSFLDAKQPGLGCTLRLADLQVKAYLGWIFLHGCKF